jgi:uncharacterized protein YndB with AHSA1/START domain
VNEVRAEVTVNASPEEAFTLFTEHVDAWWRRGERYGGTDVVGHRFDAGVGGGFFEVLADREHELGRITIWEPPHRLAFSWRQGNWAPDETTEVEITFTASASGTTVALRHHGFERIRSDIGCDVGYADGWSELLGWFATQAETPSTPEESMQTPTG